MLEAKRMFGPIKNVVFDFDGTLVDSMASVIDGLGSALEATLGRRISEQELLASFGPAPQDVIRKWVPEAQVAETFAKWIAFEAKQTPADFIPFEGVEELLEGLKKLGIGIGIFTGRDRLGTLRIAKHQQWVGKFFDEAGMICGDDGFAAKPKPDALIELLGRMKWDPATVLMVGDHAYDMMAGQAAGTKTAAALWDLPKGKATEKGRFREGWKKWDSVPCDLRLASPKSLLAWFNT